MDDITSQFQGKTSRERGQKLYKRRSKVSATWYATHTVDTVDPPRYDVTTWRCCHGWWVSVSWFRSPKTKGWRAPKWWALEKVDETAEKKMAMFGICLDFSGVQYSHGVKFLEVWCTYFHYRFTGKSPNKSDGFKQFSSIFQDVFHSISLWLPWPSYQEFFEGFSCDFL